MIDNIEKYHQSRSGWWYFDALWQQLKMQFIQWLQVFLEQVILEYPLPNGAKVKFLDDNVTYLGNQLESEFGGDRCFGILANMDFIMVCTYEAEGANPELVLYKKR
ncbi:hypothetical protein [Butyrivibrio sp. AE3009]|uniref:hypothetical protein n=1 Tax=Butyrivibrio sp. AE3009 TaxID=1280666 RepID=UPI0024183081|nr:hypothetical protein [Butyrivibrio sp. AE3009]